MTPARAGALAVSFAIAFATYARSAPLEPGSWDTAEMQTVPWILGIAHPTGFPLYTLGGWLFTHLVPIGSVAWRMNALSALCVATACTAVCAIALTLEAGAFEAVLGTLAFTWCTAAWNKGSHADPHAMSLAFIMLALLFAVRYGRGGRSPDLIVASAAAGCGLATHPEAMFALPALALAFGTRRARPLRAAVLGLAAIAAPLLLYAYLPLRSAYVAAHGLDPLALPPFDGSVPSLWDANHARTLEGFLDEVTGRQFGASSAVMAFFNVRDYAAAGAYWWQQMRPQTVVLELVLAALGTIALAVRDVRSLAILGAGTLSGLPFVFAYRDIEGDIDRYFMPSFALLAVLAALCSRLPFMAAGEPASRAFTRQRVTPILTALTACVLLAFAAATQWNANASTLTFRNDTGSRPMIESVARITPANAIVVAGWVDATSLQYAAYVEGKLGARTIVTGWPGAFRDRYARWAAVRPVYIYADPSTSGSIKDLPPAWIVAVPGSDGYHLVVRIQPPTGSR